MHHVTPTDDWQESPPPPWPGSTFVHPLSESDQQQGFIAGFVQTLGSERMEWMVSGVVQRLGDRLVVSKLTIEPHPYLLIEEAAPPGHRLADRRPSEVASGGIQSATLRDVRLGEILNVVRSLLARGPGFVADLEARGFGVVDGFEDRRTRAIAAAEASRGVALKRGRGGYPDDHYRRIALLYLDLQNKKWSKGILKEMARLENRPWQTIRDWVSRAGELEFLSEGTPGKAGREPGPRLYDIDGED